MGILYLCMHLILELLQIIPGWQESSYRTEAHCLPDPVVAPLPVLPYVQGRQSRSRNSREWNHYYYKDKMPKTLNATRKLLGTVNHLFQIQTYLLAISFFVCQFFFLVDQQQKL